MDELVFKKDCLYFQIREGCFMDNFYCVRHGNVFLGHGLFKNVDCSKCLYYQSKNQLLLDV